MQIWSDEWAVSMELNVVATLEEGPAGCEPTPVVLLEDCEGFAPFDLNREQALELVDALIWAVAELDRGICQARLKKLHDLKEKNNG